MIKDFINNFIIKSHNPLEIFTKFPMIKAKIREIIRNLVNNTEYQIAIVSTKLDKNVLTSYKGMNLDSSQQ